MVFTACLAWGQTVDKSQTFDVASVKPATPPTPDGRGRIMMDGPSGGPGTKDPGRIHYPNMSLKLLLMNAYGVKTFQVVGPPWLDTERFDLNATMPPETTKEQFRVMLQNLLAERFKVTVHKETKDLPMYALVLAKNGPKMKESEEVTGAKDDPDAPPPPPPSRPQIGPDGFPVIPLAALGRGGIFGIMMPGRTRLIGQRQTMQDLASRLTGQLNRPVTDETGLKANYDFTLTYSPTEGMTGPMGLMAPPPQPPGGSAAGGSADNVFRPDGDAPPDLFTAVQAQLGLKLESKKGQVELVVVDHAEKTPTNN